MIFRKRVHSVNSTRTLHVYNNARTRTRGSFIIYVYIYVRSSWHESPPKRVERPTKWVLKRFCVPFAHTQWRRRDGGGGGGGDDDDDGRASRAADYSFRSSARRACDAMPAAAPVPHPFFCRSVPDRSRAFPRLYTPPELLLSFFLFFFSSPS